MDLKANAVNTVKGAAGVFLQDLQALPEEAFCQCFGPVTRTVADLVYEVNLVNDHVGMVLRGEEPFDWPEGGWIKAPEDFRDKETVVSAFQKSSAKIVETIEAFTLEDLEGTVETEHGERTRFSRCQFMALHMWYHSGQLNFIQTLRGDVEWHWK